MRWALTNRIRLAVWGLMLSVLLATAASAGAKGSAWSLREAPLPVGAKSAVLVSVSCASQSACVAVGASCKRDPTCSPYDPSVWALVERWDGSRWAIEPIARPAGAKAGMLVTVSCPAPRTCVAAGDYLDGSGRDLAFVERSSGSRWSMQRIPEPLPSTVTGVSCPSTTMCMAVGSLSNNATETVHTFAERWTPGGWSELTTPPLMTGDWDARFFAVSCSSATACMAVGTTDIGHDRGCDYAELALTERWDGHRWSLQSAECFQGMSAALGDVSCTPSRYCMAVGGGGNSGGDIPIAEQWIGARWHSASPDNSSPLISVSCTSRKACVAVESAFSIARVQVWNGRAWSGSDIARGDLRLAAVSCRSSTACVAVGASGRHPTSLVLGARPSSGRG